MNLVARVGVTPEQYALVMRQERDALISAWHNGIIEKSIEGVVALLNARIKGLGIETTSFDAFDDLHR